MTSVLTLIGAPGNAALVADRIDRARRALDASGASPATPDWLVEGDACDIPFIGDPAAALAAVRDALDGEPVDIAVMDAERRRKRLLIADMDSTLIEEECIDVLAARVGLGERVAAITDRAMRGEISFEPALRERVALLRGVASALVEEVSRTAIHPCPGGRTLSATMRRFGGRTVIVSGGFTRFTRPVRDAMGFDLDFANVLIEEGDTLAGEVAEPVLGRDAKLGTLRMLVARYGLHPSETIAAGDGANDLDMLRAAGLGVGVRPKPIVREAVAAVIDHGDLTALLFLQGYRRDEFVSAD